MANFPRFTKGSIGNLQWFHMNGVFDAIERGGVPMRRYTEPRESQFVYAILTGTQVVTTGQTTQRRYAWKEIRLRSDGTSQVDPPDSVRTSGTQNAPFTVPAIAIGPADYQVGAQVLLRLESFIDVGRCALIISNVGAKTGMFRITGSQPLVGGRWKYTGLPMGVELDSWVQRDTEPYTLYNGCENPTDAGNVIGVGTVKPNNATAVRQPIRNETIVHATYVDFAWTFSVPNGYSFACA
jgi:hypothetical protein